MKSYDFSKMSVILEQRSQPQHVVHLFGVTKKATESLWTRGPFKCELTSIRSADVEGCSRLIAEDEDAPIRTLTAYREIMASLIQKHRGRVVDSPRDNTAIYKLKSFFKIAQLCPGLLIML